MNIRMNIALWVLQIFLALHTAMGAVWKLSHSAAESAPSLSALPHGVWTALMVVEVLCAAALVAPLVKKTWMTIAVAAACVIAAEMLLFIGVHVASGSTDSGQPVYWIVVAALCGLLAFGRIRMAKRSLPPAPASRNSFPPGAPSGNSFPPGAPSGN
jgi:hypothetical protein